MTANREAENKARKESELAAKEKARLDAEQAKKAKEAEDKARKESELAAKEKARLDAEQANRPVRKNIGLTQQGTAVMLEMANPTLFDEIYKLQKRLENVDGLKVIVTGGSQHEGVFIGVSVQKPMDLISVLSNMPMVEDAFAKGEKIVVVLKASNIR